MASRPKVILVVGSHGCGKTALLRRILENTWVPNTPPTIGLDDKAGALSVDSSNLDLSDRLLELMPAGGVEACFWEIGGKDGHLRGAPRGRPIDGLLLCFDVLDRASFQAAAHLLLQHRADRHMEHDRTTVVARSSKHARLAAVLCGTQADKADETGEPMVSYAEAVDFVSRSGLGGPFVTSAKTGEGATEAIQGLLAEILKEEEEAESELAAIASEPPLVRESWSLARPGNTDRGIGSMTSPRGLRPHEPPRGTPASPLVEVLDKEGNVYGVRPLDICLQRGLLHRAVHVWLFDPKTGGMLLRRYSRSWGDSKIPGRWGPTSRGEVLCYKPESGALAGPQASELSSHAATRILRDQVGLDVTPSSLEHWFSCRSQEGSCIELVEVYGQSLDVSGGLPELRFRNDEDVEWHHFTDIFHETAPEESNPGLFCIPHQYNTAMVRKMTGLVQHSFTSSIRGLEPAHQPVGLSRGRPHCPLPVVATSPLMSYSKFLGRERERHAPLQKSS